MPGRYIGYEKAAELENFQSGCLCCQAPSKGPVYLYLGGIPWLETTENAKVTLYAQWIPNTYYIYLNGNGCESAWMTAMECIYDQEYILDACTFEMDGYTFAGWNTEADGSGIAYVDKASVKNLVSESGGNAVLWAQWEPNTIAVPEEGEDTPGSVPGESDENTPETENNSGSGENADKSAQEETAVNTGDNGNVGIIILVMVIAACIAGAALFAKRRNKE